jgi:hypothetical protein
MRTEDLSFLPCLYFGFKKEARNVVSLDTLFLTTNFYSHSSTLRPIVFVFMKACNIMHLPQTGGSFLEWVRE